MTLPLLLLFIKSMGECHIQMDEWGACVKDQFAANVQYYEFHMCLLCGPPGTLGLMEAKLG